MRAIHRVTISMGILCSIAIPGAALAAATDCKSVQRLSPLDNRLAGWASQGVTTLRQRVTASKGVYRFNVAEAMETGMRHHELRKSCGMSVADAGGVAESVESRP